MLGLAASPFTNGLQRISDIVVPSGSNLQDLNLPIDPNGVIYDSIARTPIAGATLTLLDASSASPLPATCFDDPAQQGQVTLADGYYKFDINFRDPACPSGGDYLIEVTAPGTDVHGRLLAAHSADVGRFDGRRSRCRPARAAPTTRCRARLDFCEVQASEFAPPPSVPARTPARSTTST